MIAMQYFYAFVKNATGYAKNDKLKHTTHIIYIIYLQFPEMKD